jgi:hypothetical protein
MSHSKENTQGSEAKGSEAKVADRLKRTYFGTIPTTTRVCLLITAKHSESRPHHRAVGALHSQAYWDPSSP